MKTLKFPHESVQPPAVRPVQERRTDFSEIQQSPTDQSSSTQAGRCSQCGIPMCQSHCPLGNNIPDWLNAAANGFWQEAHELSSATNTFPEICGRICPQDRLCEGHCVIEKDFQSVTIGAVESKINEVAWDNEWIQPISPSYELDDRVAIVGSGPGGLAAACELRKRGIQVDVFERQERAGGLLMYGIPHFKLDKAVVQRRLDWMTSSGVKFFTGVKIGTDKSLKELRQKYSAVILATGVYRAYQLGFLQESHVPSFKAFDFLKSNNRQELGDKDIEPRHIDLTGKKIAVLGAGDTAMDCVRTAVRRGAEKVYCIYRRDKQNRSGSMKELKYAEEEGVEFMYLQQPVRFDAPNRLVLQRQVLSAVEADGRQRPIPSEDEPTRLECDLVIEALGFEPEDVVQLFNEPELRVDPNRGTVQTVPGTSRTSLPGVYAVGDIVRGASLVVWAIRDGRECAEEILSDLRKDKSWPISKTI